MRILILGSTGMLGSTLFRYLSAESGDTVFGSIRGTFAPKQFSELASNQRVLPCIAAESDDRLREAFLSARPDVVLNCIGVVKQLAEADKPLLSIPVNALLPHRIANIAAETSARVIHISTDCVFAGKTGHYKESDTPDATDLYGRSKLLGELYSAGCVTLRTSIIGHELSTKHGLLEWFLSQSGQVQGFSKAIFSGLPTVELARVIRQFVIPNTELSGLYHVAASPISKLELLRLIAETYGMPTTIMPSDSVVIDRSLDATKFNSATRYTPPVWPKLVEEMHKFH